MCRDRVVDRGGGGGRGRLALIKFHARPHARVGCVCVCARAWEGNWNWNWNWVWDWGLGIDTLQFDLHLCLLLLPRKVFAIQLKREIERERDLTQATTPHLLLPPGGINAASRRVAGDVSIIGIAYAHNGSTNTRALVV